MATLIASEYDNRFSEMLQLCDSVFAGIIAGIFSAKSAFNVLTSYE
jgi:hypothetical protein